MPVKMSPQMIVPHNESSGFFNLCLLFRWWDHCHPNKQSRRMRRRGLLL